MSTDVCNQNFQELLNKFHKLLKSNPVGGREFEDLEKETLTKILTEHQVSAIIERCNNVLNGTYGSTSKQLSNPIK